MEKTTAETIKFVRGWIAEHGTSENLERLLHGLEYEDALRVDLIPEEIFHDLCEGNVSAIPLDDVQKNQEAYPEYDWNALRERGINVLKYGWPVLLS